MPKKIELSRRGLLSGAALSTLPLGAGCGRLAADLPGEIRGASMALGHALREPLAGSAATLEQAGSAEPERVGVAIVGGGASGLSAAWRLERLGYHDYRLLELEARAGGTAAYASD